MKNPISFKKINIGDYKYELIVPHLEKLPEIPVNILAEVPQYIKLHHQTILIKDKYRWDGCSGPTWDDSSNMRAGLVHDALYQLIREKKLDKGYRDTADKIFYRILREDGMFILRAKYYYLAVRAVGWKYV